MKIEGKVAWITGASSGIGEALAAELFNRGATVILSARSAVKLEEIKARFDEKTPGRCIVVPCDVTKTSSVKEAIDQVKKLAGYVDILVNNAGITTPVPHDDLESLTDEWIDKIMQTNFRGSFAMVRAMKQLLIANTGIQNSESAILSSEF